LDANITLVDASVAPHQEERVVTEEDRYYLTGCASASGTWRRQSETDGVGWIPVRQAFIAADEPLRLGNHSSTARELVKMASAASPSERPDFSDSDARWRPNTARLQGRVERNPTTGEIVRRRT
ncbi:MAG: hypothetical protein ACR2QF_09820, partial [Geminicoccaceae bacterium]